jgi:predicted NBD/HSP70 family sugar kinase
VTQAKKKVLVVDIGGTGVKILATGQAERRRFPSGRELTPELMVSQVKELAADWKYDAVAIGYPGRVVEDCAVTEPRNLAPGWVGFDFAAAFGRPVKVINDASMQALGSYKGGTMLFLGLGTGLGSTLIVRGHIVPMELGALSWGKGSIEDHVGLRGLKKYGKKKWRASVKMILERFTSALLLDDAVIGGGNAKKLKELPPGCRFGDNAFAFLGGFRMWEPASVRMALATPRRVSVAASKNAERKTKGASK